jgi:hypothetical protein
MKEAALTLSERPLEILNVSERVWTQSFL